MIDFWRHVTESIPPERSKAWLCRQIGVDSATMLSWIKHDRLPRADVAVKIAMTLGLSAEYLLTGEQSTHHTSVDADLETTVSVPLLIQTRIPEIPVVGDRIVVPKFLVRGCGESSLGAVQFQGDSMIDEQMIHGDVVIYTDKVNRGEGLYVLEIHKDILVRRVQFNPQECSLSLLSGNRRYRGTQTIPMYHEHVRILGKVVAWFHRNV